MDDTREIAAKAADILRSDGWTQHQYVNTDTGAHCMVGAMIEATYPGRLGDWLDNPDDHGVMHPNSLDADDPLRRLFHWMESDIAPEYGILVWNDSFIRTEEEVLAALDRASLLS